MQSSNELHTLKKRERTNRERKCLNKQTNKKKTPWTLVRKRTIPTDRLPLVDEI
jgi:hypothetical protein